jgi:hypothetical protein
MARSSKWRDVPQWALQREFLAGLSAEAPVVVESLKELVPHASEIAEADACEPFWPDGPTPPGPLGDLWAWAARFHFRDEWILKAALKTLRDWSVRRAVGLPEAFHLRHPGTGLYIDPTAFVANWDPMLQSETDFRRALDADLSTYIDKKRAQLHSQGYLLAGEVREQQHIPWTIRYQALGMSFAGIARMLPTGKDAPDRRRNVEKAVKATAALLGLTLRSPLKRRRPTTAPERVVDHDSKHASQ